MFISRIHSYYKRVLRQMLFWSSRGDKLTERAALRRATIYFRPGCHLCDDAAGLLAEAGYQVDWVNIDEDEQLKRQFDACVPVVEIDGKVRFRGKVDPLLLSRLP
jgi:glutaredoxin